LEEWALEVMEMEFPVLLSYPIHRNLEVTNPPEYLYKAKLKEDCIEVDPPSCLPDGVPTFNGYSGSGNVTGQLVYVNFGRKEDFEALNGTVDFRGKIVVVRYGKIYRFFFNILSFILSFILFKRGNKPANAEEYGAVGCIIFTDPAIYGYLQGIMINSILFV
jgi:N-acetylated-alpha-linked acidic dipeptidase